MINRLIELSLRNRLWVVCATIFFVLAGIEALRRLPVDALPDMGDRQILVVAEWPGFGPQEIEDRVTVPLVTELTGLTGRRDVRASSMFGFAFISIILDDEADVQVTRALALERINRADLLPAGARVRLGPDAAGTGWIYQYYLQVDPATATQDLARLRALQDWHIRYELASVPDVAEVASLGGRERQFLVAVSSHRLRHAGLSLKAVMDAVRDSSLNVGAKTIDENGWGIIVRGVGLLDGAGGVGQLGRVAVGRSNDRPVYLRDVASITEGGAWRTGTLDINGLEAVGGIVVMRQGANARKVLRDVHAKVAALQRALPPGVSIRPF